VSERISNRQGCACGACLGTGWLGYHREVVTEQGECVTDRHPWAGACYCVAGVHLTQSREPNRPTDPRPVVVHHVPREVYTRRLAEADERRGVVL